MRSILNLFGVWRTPAARQPTNPPSATERSVTIAGANADETSDVVKESERYFAARRYAEAFALVDDALAAAPASQVLLFACGSILFHWGRFHEALLRYQQAAEAGLVDVDLHLQLGWTCSRLELLEEAEQHFRRAVAAFPDSESAWIALANLLETRGTLAREARNFASILCRWPENYQALMLLAACRFHLSDRLGGLETFRNATELDPTHPQGWSNLGVALGHEGSYAEGLEALRRAYEIDASNGQSGSVFNYATALREEGRREDALRVVEDNVFRNPDPRLLWLRSMFLLEDGRFTEGFIDHEFRWMREPLVSMRWTFRRPVWAGQDLRGKTLLLRAEQGAGDAIQFIRYARVLKERGARVLFGSFKGVLEISHDFENVDGVVADGRMPPFDYHIALLSLPRVLGTVQSSIPSGVPYVKVRPEHRTKWSALIGVSNELKVGLVWAGNPNHVRDRMRSIPLEKLAPLARVGGVKLYSLQKSPTASDDIASSGFALVDLGQHFVDFCDTAAAISHLDLVISVDTSVAHLAGALAKPVWIMVADPCDWRWQICDEYTPWYPTMRIFRQHERDNWDGVVDAIANQLREAAGVRGRTSFALDASTRDRMTAHSNQDCVHQVSGFNHTLQEAHPWRVDETRYGIVQYPSRPEGIAESLRYYGEYAHLQMQTIARFVRPGSWVLEADAGFGMATLFLAEAVGSNGHVLAFEADRLLAQIARQNLSANRVHNVTFLSRKLKEQPARGHSPHGPPPETVVETDTIDGLRLSQLDWVFINDASRCRSILTGAESTLWARRPWLWIGGASPDDLGEADSIAHTYGYAVRTVKTPLFNPENYNRRTDDLFAGRGTMAMLLIPEEIDIDIELERGAVVS
jgi:tetratricopeptide (TPR) repeat protein